MAEGGRERPRAGECAATVSVARDRSHPFQVPVSGLTSRQLRHHRSSMPAQGLRLGSISGRRICVPGVSRETNDWRVPAEYTVGAILGILVFVVGDDGAVDANGERHRVSAVIVARHQCPAPPSYQLFECADEQDFVTVVCGAHVAEFVGMPCEERPLIDLEDVATPPSPDSPRSRS